MVYDDFILVISYLLFSACCFPADFVFFAFHSHLHETLVSGGRRGVFLDGGTQTAMPGRLEHDQSTRSWIMRSFGLSGNNEYDD